MILASVNDDSLFAPENQAVLGYESWLVMHLMAICQSHVIVTQDLIKSRLMIKNLLKRVDCSDEIKSIVIASLEDQGGRKLVPINDPLKIDQVARSVDVFVAASDESLKQLADLWRVPYADERLCCWHNYHKSVNKTDRAEGARTVLLDYMGRGALSIKGWSADAFKRHILRPVLRWSVYVQVWDRYLGKACEDNEGNKESYLKTICMIIREWAKSCVWEAGEIGQFVINTDVRDPVLVTECILNKLSNIPPEYQEKIVVRNPSFSERERNNAYHDRYMQTSVANLAFSRGFDVIIPEHNTCRECTVSMVRSVPKDRY